MGIDYVQPEQKLIFDPLPRFVWKYPDLKKIKMSLLTQIWRCMINREQPLIDKFKCETVVSESIYPMKGEKLGVYCRKFHFIHYILKYKFFVPALLIARRMLRRCGDYEIKDEWYNKNIQIWNDSYKEAMDVLAQYYNPSFGNPKKLSFKSYDTIRVLCNTLVLNDTATREFHNVLMHTIAKNMLNAYKGSEAYHIFYCGRDSYNPVYFKMAQMIMKENKSPKDALAHTFELHEKGDGIYAKEVHNSASITSNPALVSQKGLQTQMESPGGCSSVKPATTEGQTVKPDIKENVKRNQTETVLPNEGTVQSERRDKKTCAGCPYIRFFELFQEITNTNEVKG